MMLEDTATLPCAVSNLDWLSYKGGAITVKAGRSSINRAHFRRQLDICGCCIYREPCLELGMEEDWGIWGGKFPHERRAIKSRRTP